MDRSQDDGDAFASSALLVSEVLRAAVRRGVDRVVARPVLGQVDLFVPDMPVFRAAGPLSRSAPRALDALHVSACLAIGAAVFVSDDARRMEAANAVGIATGA